MEDEMNDALMTSEDGLPRHSAQNFVAGSKTFSRKPSISVTNKNTIIMEGDYDTDIPNIDDYHTELVEFLVDNPNMKHAARSAMKQGLGAAAGATMGGLFLGPVGGLVGGILGSVVGFLAVDDYDGVVQQIVKLQSETQKERLIKGVRQVLMTAGASMPTTASGFRGALVEFAQQRNVREQVWNLCMDAVNSEPLRR